jgi:hypothetical protein
MPQLDAVGTFDVEVQQADSYLGESQTGTPYIGLPFTVSSGDHIGDYITAYLYLSDAAFDRTIGTLAHAFSWDGDLEALANGSFSFAGMPATIVTKSETYEGRQVTKVSWINRLGESGGGGGITPIDKGKLNALIAGKGARAKAIGSKAVSDGKVAPPQRATAPAAMSPADKDDLPF